MKTDATFLLVYTLTTTGLMALAAATSRSHWFLRTAAFLTPLSALLLVPAIEPLASFVILGATVAAGVGMARRWQRRRKSKVGENPEAVATAAASAAPSSVRPRFSLSTLLLSMVLCGLAAAVAARAPVLNRYAWQSVVLIGVCGGLATLLGAWVATRDGWLVLPVAIVASAAALVLAALPALFDGFALSFAWLGSWPPQDPNANPMRGVIGDNRPVTGWFLVLPLIVWGVALIAGLYQAVEALAPARRRFHGRRLVRCVAATMLGAALFLLVTPSLQVMYGLLTPEPVPRTTAPAPAPNAYDIFVEAGRSIDKAMVNSGTFDVDKAPRADVAQAAGEVAAAVAAVRRGFDVPFAVPVDYAEGAPLLMDSIQNCRSLARALSTAGKNAVLNGKYDEALAAYLDAARLGFLMRRGGLIVDGLVGCAITNIGQWYIFPIRDQLTAEQCLAAIESISHWSSEADSFESMEYRDYVWTQRALGWHGRLQLFLAYETGDYVVGQYRESFDKEAARTRLLLAHLALQAHLARGNPLPDDWSAIEAAGLPPLAADPFDPDGGTLRYRRDGATALLYSVGPNGVDDGGRPPDKDDTGWQDTNTGDLRLDAMFSD